MNDPCRLKLLSVGIAALLILSGCASIPPEAPDLSIQLGKRISALQDSNIVLLHRFFDLKRAEVDRFIQDEWVPAFAEEVFSDPAVKDAWQIIVTENNPVENLKFLIKTGPKLQAKINKKRVELIRPLDEIEKRIEENLRNEYGQAAAINNVLTSFLLSASKVEQNRNRYLEMLGVTDKAIGNAIDQIDTIVNALAAYSDKAGKAENATQEYLKKLKELKDSLFNK